MTEDDRQFRTQPAESETCRYCDEVLETDAERMRGAHEECAPNAGDS